MTEAGPSRSAAPRLDLKYVGLNHSDSTLVILLPKEKIIFVVDSDSALERLPGRGMIDFYPMEAEAFDQEDHCAWTGNG